MADGSDLRKWSWTFEMGDASTSPESTREVMRINPSAKVPVLVDGDLELFDSTQILRLFVAKPFKTEPRCAGRAQGAGYAGAA